VNWINLFRSVQLCSVCPFEDAFDEDSEELLLVASNSQILFAQNTSHFNEASGKAVDEQSQQGSKEHLQ